MLCRLLSLKGQSFPVTGHEGSEGEMECSASIHLLAFGTIRTAELSALRADGALPPRKFVGTLISVRGQVDLMAIECG